MPRLELLAGSAAERLSRDWSARDREELLGSPLMLGVQREAGRVTSAVRLGATEGERDVRKTIKMMEGLYIPEVDGPRTRVLVRQAARRPPSGHVILTLKQAKGAIGGNVFPTYLSEDDREDIAGKRGRPSGPYTLRAVVAYDSPGEPVLLIWNQSDWSPFPSVRDGSGLPGPEHSFSVPFIVTELEPADGTGGWNSMGLVYLSPQAEEPECVIEGWG